jgi:hypothetical protein
MDRLLTRSSARAAVPHYIEVWFAGKGWELRPYQRKMIDTFARRRSTRRPAACSIQHPRGYVLIYRDKLWAVGQR